MGALNRFKAKDCNILICTDVASRGLDIQGVDMVINYDIPMNSKVSSVRFSTCLKCSDFISTAYNVYIWICYDYKSFVAPHIGLCSSGG